MAITLPGSARPARHKSPTWSAADGDQRPPVIDRLLAGRPALAGSVEDSRDCQRHSTARPVHDDQPPVAIDRYKSLTGPAAAMSGQTGADHQ
jgi:hypothetical protein